MPLIPSLSPLTHLHSYIRVYPQSRRPLVPVDMPMSDEVKEVLDTFRIAARLGRTSLGAYVISMAKSASDVLLVELLQREAAMQVGGVGEVDQWWDHFDMPISGCKWGPPPIIIILPPSIAGRCPGWHPAQPAGHPSCCPAVRDAGRLARW
jgi:hypothetical protein